MTKVWPLASVAVTTSPKLTLDNVIGWPWSSVVVKSTSPVKDDVGATAADVIGTMEDVVTVLPWPLTVVIGTIVLETTGAVVGAAEALELAVVTASVVVDGTAVGARMTGVLEATEESEVDC